MSTSRESSDVVCGVLLMAHGMFGLSISPYAAHNGSPAVIFTYVLCVGTLLSSFYFFHKSGSTIFN